MLKVPPFLTLVISPPSLPVIKAVYPNPIFTGLRPIGAILISWTGAPITGLRLLTNGVKLLTTGLRFVKRELGLLMRRIGLLVKIDGWEISWLLKSESLLSGRDSAIFKSLSAFAKSKVTS